MLNMKIDYSTARNLFDLNKAICRLEGLDWVDMCAALMKEIANAESADLSLQASGKEIVNMQRNYLRALRWFYATLRDEQPRSSLLVEIQQMFTPLLTELAAKQQFSLDRR